MKQEFIAVCLRQPGNELISGECAHLTGGVPDKDGVAFCQRVDAILQAAYVRTGVRILAVVKALGLGEVGRIGNPTHQPAEASNPQTALKTLAQRILDLQIEAEDFRIEVLNLAQQVHIHQFDAIRLLADALKAFPNLDAPRHRFLLGIQDQQVWFGEIVTESDQRYEKHNAKPCHTSSSLPAQMARALVNLVVPLARILVDPCCGSGSILLEAQALGLQAFGADWNWKMVSAARRNLAYFGYPGLVERADARQYDRRADALVTDLPYGKMARYNEQVTRAILDQGARLAPLAVYVAQENITGWLQDAGYHQVEVYPVAKHRGLTRYVHRAWS